MAIDSYEMPDDGIPLATTVQSFLAWTTQAGLPADEHLVTKALDPDARGPERLFTLLLEATRIAPARA
ncbi:hypothetical protein EV652_12046 [Kribbella steppae]|uniref:Uncharacterized protein n=1 Tax=Kribbella steppae TaxID=2512223 RepID=A0A4R2GYM0_9ACTN|nr:hypothetical protein [Kribbella steppae]TCO16553.1 hypothetical protein EV652_12046 [Kribbella steppae]